MSTDLEQPVPGPIDADPHGTVRPATLAVTAGRPARTRGAPVNPPVVLSSTYVSTGTPPAGELLYARIDTETWHPFEDALGRLEHSRHPALVLGSGMAAIAAAMSLVPRGGRLVLPRHAYQVSLGLAADLASRTGLETELVDIDDTAAVLAAVRGDATRAPAAMLWVESPTNPMLEVADLPALAAGARDVGALVVVDNTFATPLVQRPLTQGADVVVHSVTKYLAGHSDVVLGAVVTDDDDLRARLHSYRTVHGAVAGPWEVWLALRGLRTLALRVERAQSSAAVLAARLAEHPSVVEVRHPSLPGDPGHARALALMDGFGAILCLRPGGGAPAADALTEAVRLWVPATSLGGVESTLERRRRFATESPTVPEDLVRLSVGIEDVEDLWADLDQALRAGRPA
ncbi:aminotransferase class I/II-fold pyridoxal phosphate-dependent enzyme [Actinotalea sp. K2]|uniref:trans-sulfuration enzyme family protein n=1 Tax=Actinotalea sp. K2 TaxID=2939438 RepID=UPI00201832DE|nr:aminotransferase class I/II-fold pyridoxal phosphate-dependent enzyme [Actinotalea sp. K2]MCL3860532.1 aminotransferase class I/II-fold pyridoxal phosphate-dependent enzyme [Actinotalea sp. K2]